MLNVLYVQDICPIYVNFAASNLTITRDGIGAFVLLVNGDPSHRCLSLGSFCSLSWLLAALGASRSATVGIPPDSNEPSPAHHPAVLHSDRIARPTLVGIRLLGGDTLAKRPSLSPIVVYKYYFRVGVSGAKLWVDRFYMRQPS